MRTLYPRQPLRVRRILFFFALFHAYCLDLKGICQGHCLILFVYIGDSADVGGVLTFYIPSVLDD
jgi:hypothetical protein